MNAVIDTSRTSIPGTLAPSVKYLIDKGIIKAGMRVLDFGSGRFLRNAIPMREMGITVYAYDPLNCNDEDGDGFKDGVISGTLPDSAEIDLVLSAYVLNVLTNEQEEDCLETLSVCYSGIPQYHIVRNRDLLEIVQYKNMSFGKSKQEADAILREGFVTQSGFQRFSEPSGMEMIRKESGFRIFRKV